MSLKRSTVFRLVKEPYERGSFVNKSTQYYLNIYDHFHGKRKLFYSWNWASFLSSLFGAEIIWLVYRRMYLYAFFYAIFFFVVVYSGILLIRSTDIPHVLLQYIKDKEVFMLVFKFFSWIIKLPVILSFGVFGNALYFRFLEKEAEKKYLPKNGVSMLVACIVLFLMITLVLGGHYIAQTYNVNFYSKMYEYFF